MTTSCATCRFRKLLVLLVLASLAVWPPWGMAQDVVAAASSGSVDPKTVVARVNGAPIEAAEVQRAVATALAGRNVTAESRSHLEAEALAQLIDRHLVEEAISKSPEATTSDVDAAVERMNAQLKSQGRELGDLLREQGIDPKALRQKIAWQLRWQQYVRDRLTDRALAAYFAAHHRDFDGTQLRVRHILFRPASSPQALAEATRRASAVRDEIVKGKLTFAEAAKRHSAGPSREKGGDLGFIPRRGVMAENFAREAFQLQKGEVSSPVTTTFGVHLIEATDSKPGTLSWTDVREDLAAPATQALYEDLAEQGRRSAKIEFTGAMAHYPPSARERSKAEGDTGVKRPAASKSK